MEGKDPARIRRFLWKRLVVPQCPTLRVLMAYHVEMGHMGSDTMEKKVRRRYYLCTVRNVRQLLGEVKSQCQTCQACAPITGPLLDQLR